jgi:hypothetical protein
MGIGAIVSQSAKTLQSLANVLITGAQNGQPLLYQASTAKWVNQYDQLANLSDVGITGPTDGQLLQYSAAQGKWLNVATPAVAALVKLQTVTVTGSPAARITLGAGNTISQGYSDLIIRCNAASDQAGGADGDIQFNGDTGAHYDDQTLIFNNKVVFGIFPDLAQTVIPAAISLAPQAISPVSCVSEIIVFDYARTTFQKVMQSRKSLKNANNNASFYTVAIDGYWRSTAAITQVDLIPEAGNFAVGSQVIMWGRA